jgi:hypothetical protein
MPQATVDSEPTLPPDDDAITITVYHVEKEAPRGLAFWEHPDPWNKRGEFYRKVATVEVPRSVSLKDSSAADDGTGGTGETDEADRSPRAALEEAWAALQNGAGSAASADVTNHVNKRRSTSVGDVMVLCRPGDGKAESEVPFEVGTLGFREIATENPEPSIGGNDLVPIGELK